MGVHALTVLIVELCLVVGAPGIWCGKSAKMLSREAQISSFSRKMAHSPGPPSPSREVSVSSWDSEREGVLF